MTPLMTLDVNATLVETTHLSFEARGVYLTLVMHMSRNPDGTLKDDDGFLCRLLHMHGNKWRTIKDEIGDLLVSAGGYLSAKTRTKQDEIPEKSLGKSDEKSEKSSRKVGENPMKSPRKIGEKFEKSRRKVGEKSEKISGNSNADLEKLNKNNDFDQCASESSGGELTDEIVDFDIKKTGDMSGLEFDGPKNRPPLVPPPFPLHPLSPPYNPPPEKKLPPYPPKENSAEDSSATLGRKEFADWWDVYPKKVDKGAATKAFSAALKRVDLDVLMDRTRRYAAYCERQYGRDKTFVKGPAAWLRADKWGDEYLLSDEAVTEASTADQPKEYWEIVKAERAQRSADLAKQKASQSKPDRALALTGQGGRS